MFCHPIGVGNERARLFRKITGKSPPDSLRYVALVQGYAVPHSPQCTLIGFGPSNVPFAGRSALHEGHFVSSCAAHFGQNFGASKIKVE
jgi:hypothetical protein